MKIIFLQLLQRNEEKKNHQMRSWEDMKDIVQIEAKKHILCKRRRKQPRISQSALDLAGRRKRAEADGNQMEWSRLNKEVIMDVKEDGRTFVVEKCE